MSRNALRGALRERRRSLDAQSRERQSAAIARHILKAIGPAPHGRRIAGFAALAEEPDLTKALAALARRGALVYLPRIVNYRRRQLAFALAGGVLRPNRYGIAEPARNARVVRARELDVVLVPLVGFDSAGARLGMGGGYYDRAFAFRRHRRAVSRPRLIGIAFACQQVDRLAAEPHDVRLDAVITERGLTRFHRSPR